MNSVTKMRFILLSYVLLVILVSLVPTSGEPSTWPVDKVGHFLAYAGMAVLALFSFAALPARLVALVAAAGLGALLEWGQSSIPGRDMSWIDELANVFGLLAGAAAFRFYGRILFEWARSRLGSRTS